MEESRYKAIAACSRFDNELEAFLEGEARPFINAHARDCASCGTLLAELQAIREAARELPLETPSRVVWASLRAKLQAEGAFTAPACAQFDAELEAYLEGEVRPFIIAHAQDCPSCGAVLADLQAIQQAARDLPQEEPSRVVWASLRARLEAEGAFAVPACAQFDAELEAYLEGEARPFIASHTQDCAPCGAVLADIQAIREAARELPQEEPSRVVWANIRARLEAEGAFGVPVSGWRQILAWRVFPHAIPLGVLAALVMLGSLLTLRDVQRWGNLPGTADSSAVASIASALPAGDIALAHVVSDLERNFRANEASMTPDLKATYEKSLVSLDGSIRECLDSLQHEPSNTLAHDYLLTAYTRKAEVLSSALEFDGR
jgi:predicted nucleic acid-binding protein